MVVLVNKVVVVLVKSVGVHEPAAVVVQAGRRGESGGRGRASELGGRCASEIGGVHETATVVV